MKAQERHSELTTLFSALADHTRLRLLNLLRNGEVCVCFFTEVLGESQPKISRHLAYLRRSGLVTARRDGKWVHYRISDLGDRHLAAILEDTLDGLRDQDEMRAEYEKLEKVCNMPDAPVTITRVPRPDSFEAAESVPVRGGELETYLL